MCHTVFNYTDYRILPSMVPGELLPGLCSLLGLPSSFSAYLNPVYLGKATSTHPLLRDPFPATLLTRPSSTGTSSLSLPGLGACCSNTQLFGEHFNSHLGFFQVNKNKTFKTFYFEKFLTYIKVERIISRTWLGPCPIP